jgi:hypothetical protein
LTASPFEGVVLCGISTPFGMLSPARRQITHVLLTRAPLYRGRSPFSCDLHVLGAPLTFVLSQDQTLQLNFRCLLRSSKALAKDLDPYGDDELVTAFLIAEGRHVSHRPDLVRFRKVTSARPLVMSRRHRAFREPTLDLSKVNVRFSFQGPRQFALRRSALGSRILLAGFSSSTSFLPVWKFPSEPPRATPFVSEGNTFEERSIGRRVVAFAGTTPFRAFAGSPLLDLPTPKRLGVAEMRARCSSVLEPSSFRYPAEAPQSRRT